MTGHIQLGRAVDVVLKHYCLVDPKDYQAATANPYAARISGGGGYSDLDTFSDWSITDWHMGVGHTNPEEGPWFSFGESRYPNYFMPPPWFDFPLTAHNIFPDTASGTTDITPALSNIKYYAVSFLAPTTANIDGAWVYFSAPYNSNVYIRLHADDGTGKPGVALKTTSSTTTQLRPHPFWTVGALGTQALTAGTRYHIVVKIDSSGYVMGGTMPYIPACATVAGEKCHSSTDGTTWALEGTGLVGFYFLIPYEDTGLIYGIFPTANGLYLWADNSLGKVATGAVTDVLTPATIYDCMQDGSNIYVAYGTGYYRYDTATDTYVTYGTTPSQLFLLHGGYLWRTTSTNILYTSDETYWTDVGGVGDTVTGMAGLGDSVYFSTKYGLFMVAPGDMVVQVAAWPEADDNNGVGMVAWEDALYIPLQGGSLMRFDSSGAMINVGINAKEELPYDLRGSITALCPSNYFLFAHVRGTPSTGKHSSLWSYNVDGWHCLGIGPQNAILGGAIAIDKTNSLLYWGLNKMLLHRTAYPADVNNPANNLTTREYAPQGWVEYDKFYGGYLTLDKDFDRIHIDTKENGQHIHVYWKDATHWASSTNWTYLGTTASVTADSIPWPSVISGINYRPSGKWIRLGLRIANKDATGTATPVLRGVSVKYSTNVADRWRVVLPILISDNQQMPDGSINTYTAAEQRYYLDQYIAEIAPLQFVDMDGVSRTVKVTGASRNVLRYDWKEGSNAAAVQWVYTLTLEEVS